MKLYSIKPVSLQRFLRRIFLPSLILLTATSCASIKRGVLSSIGRMFTDEGGGDNAFTRDSDPILVEDSLPTMLKLLELMRDAAPESPELHFAVGQTAVMYAGGFLQPKMEQATSFAEKKRLQARTKAMYLRGRDNIIESLRQRYRRKGFDRKFQADNLDEFLGMTGVKDIPFLYWGGLAWLGAFALDPFDFELLTSLSRPVLLLWRALQLNPEHGSLHTSMITVMGSLADSQIAEAMSHSPDVIKPFFENFYRSRGIDPQDKKALVEYHFGESLRLSGGTDPSLYVAMATWIKGHQSTPAEDKKRFREYLEKALSIEADENVSQRLMILIYRQQAEYLLQRIEEYFL